MPLSARQLHSFFGAQTAGEAVHIPSRSLRYTLGGYNSPEPPVCFVTVSMIGNDVGLALDEVFAQPELPNLWRRRVILSRLHL